MPLDHFGDQRGKEAEVFLLTKRGGDGATYYWSGGYTWTRSASEAARFLQRRDAQGSIAILELAAGLPAGSLDAEVVEVISLRDHDRHGDPDKD